MPGGSAGGGMSELEEGKWRGVALAASEKGKGHLCRKRRG